MKTSVSVGWAINFLSLFLQSYIHLQQHTMSRSCDPYRGKYIRKFIFRNAFVGDEGTMCLRENKVRAVFSLPFFSLRGYDVTKKA